MAPNDRKISNKNFLERNGRFKQAEKMSAGGKKKRKWIPEHKFKGSIKEGQGFAFSKKHRVQHQYKKLLRKEKKKPEPSLLYEEEYPKHLKHLYLAEEEKLRNEAWSNRVKRRKLRMKEQLKEMDEHQAADDDQDEKDDADTDLTHESERTETVSETLSASVKESLPLSNRMKKKLQKQTSYQKTKEEFEKTREKREKKKEEFLKNKQQREEAMQKYKQKKMETYQILSKKTKKGQPNLNLQMEYLLQKIQGATK